MAHDSDLPCDADGACMRCKTTPSEEEKLLCVTCATPWHVTCLSSPPQTLSSTLQWQCPDCSAPASASADGAAAPSVAGGLIAAIRAIESDASLSDAEKAKRRQELMSGGSADPDAATTPDKKGKKAAADNDVLGLLDESLNCSFCRELPERPVTVKQLLSFSSKSPIRIGFDRNVGGLTLHRCVSFFHGFFPIFFYFFVFCGAHVRFRSLDFVCVCHRVKGGEDEVLYVYHHLFFSSASPLFPLPYMWQLLYGQEAF